MLTRRLVHEEAFHVTPEELFALLHMPSAIRIWWSAARAIVVPQEGGLWTAAWGNDEDSPDYITWAIIKVFDPPQRMVIGDFGYYTKSGPLPFQADFTTSFNVAPHADGATLRVEQDGFPNDSIADEFYAGCEVGWRNTFAGIRAYLNSR